MSTASNLYAEKIFSEHPLSLWAFDDKADFVSLINNNDKALSGWTITGNGSFMSTITQLPQVEDSPIVGITITDNNPVVIQSGTAINSSNFDSSKNTFNISMYFKSNSDAVVKLGYSIGGTPTTETFDYVAPIDQTWAFLSKTFELPAASQNLAIYISIEQELNASNDFYINNLSMGQWSETYATISSGVIPQPLSDYEDTTLSNSLYAIPAKTYGFAENDAYYIASPNKLYAFNDGFPMVYGASSVTKIVPNTSLPSLIVPGKGFLNAIGKYTDLTVEMWLKINPSSALPNRIFGPIESTDGIYVNGEFITIKVGSSYGSYFVGEWGRPMLVNFRVSEGIASLLIDGEQVISITVDTENTEFPQPFSNAGESQDWLGFYSYSDIDTFEIDCVAIYGYQIPEIVAKRRFVYGQGVEFPELSDASLIGASTFIDYRVANYANNYLYPDIGRWQQGITDNVLIDNNILKTPQYILPTAVFNNERITTEEWLELCSEYVADSYGSVDISLADSVTGLGGYLYFNNLNIINSQIGGIYGVFKTMATTDQILFKLVNSANNSTFTVLLSAGKIKYILQDPSASDIEIVSDITITTNTIFAAGINIQQLSRKYGGRVSRFFGSSKNIAVYIGGQENFDDYFDGRIYRIGFSTKRNINKLSALFEQDLDVMYVSGSEALQVLNHIASYTLMPKQYIDDFVLEIATDSYWQDYVPMSYLAGSVLDGAGEYESKLNFVQFNISNPVLKNIISGNYSTTNSQVKTYITFQYLSAKPNSDLSSFTNTVSLPSSGVIIPTGNWLVNKYEIIDETIIYPPANADFNDLAIVIHVEMQSKSALRNQIKIKSLQLASQAISSIEPKEISTRFGETLFAYTLRGIYPDYSSKNAVSIYKGSTPYLYLTNNSGIKMKGILGDTAPRGIRSRINEQRSNLYRVGAVQMLAKYYEDTFPTTPTKLVTFTAINKTVSLYIRSVNSTNTRALIYCLNDRTGLPDNSVYFYINGRIVKDLYITPKNWDMFGIQFQESLDFNSAIGYMDIVGPLLVHGMSNYRLTSTQDSISAILRNWSQVRTMFNNQVTYWGDFLTTDPVTTWENILYIPTLRSFLIDPRVAYKLYTGTNKIIVGDDTKLRFNKYSYRLYNDVVWQSDILDAV